MKSFVADLGVSLVKRLVFGCGCGSRTGQPQNGLPEMDKMDLKSAVHTLVQCFDPNPFDINLTFGTNQPWIQAYLGVFKK